MHKIVYLAVNKGNILVTFLLLKIVIANNYQSINPAVYLFNTFRNNRYSARVVPKCDLFPEKRMKEIFAYVLDFMHTFDKMQNTNPLMCTEHTTYRTMLTV